MNLHQLDWLNKDSEKRLRLFDTAPCKSNDIFNTHKNRPYLLAFVIIAVSLILMRIVVEGLGEAIVERGLWLLNKRLR